jgi:hypothetical protein
MSIASFDIFDTVLIRRVCHPAAVFFFVAQDALTEKLIRVSPEVYVRARREAERLARIGKPDGEVGDDRIFQLLQRLIGISLAAACRLRELEVEWETRLMTVVPGARPLIARHRAAGEIIAFVSEMYWSKSVLIELLRQHDCWQERDQLWVSSEHGASKRSGRLFHRLLAGNDGTLAKDIVHYGNDTLADGKGAEMVSIVPSLRLQANPTGYEQLLDTFCEPSGGISALLAGAGRLLRLAHAEESPVDAGIARIVGDVVAPSLALYVLWILRSARAIGLKRLYFISRDGYVPYCLARRIFAELAPEMEIFYIYGSRQAWHLAGLSELDEAAFEWLLGYCDGATPASIMRRAGLSWEEGIESAPELNTRIAQPHAAIAPEGIAALRESLCHNEVLRKKILDLAAEKRRILLLYLDQEGFGRGGEIGMVEIGWSGRTRASLERVLGADKARGLHWFYLGLVSSAKMLELDRVHTFLYGPQFAFPEIESLPVVAESFCFAPHGSVVGFTEKEGRVEPSFRPGLEDRLESWGRGKVFAAIEEYCSLLPLDMIRPTEGSDLRGPAYALLKQFTEKPSREDAELWGSIPFEHDQAAEAAETLAPSVRLSLRAFKEALTFGTFAKAAGGGRVGAWGSGAWATRARHVWPLAIGVFLGHLRVHWRGEVRRIFSEAKSFLKRVLKI